MATGGLYGSSPTGAVVAAPGSESAGLYGNGTTFGGSYFEWFIFIQSATQPATPTGGSWSFSTNSGTPPTGWSSTPPSAPTLPVWVSIALVNSKNTTALVWSAPGQFAYSSGLPILSGSGEPSSGTGLTDQLYIQTDTTPETIWFKQAGTWTRLTGSSLYVDLTTSQTIAGTKTFSSQIQGSVSGTSANVTGIVGITNGGTGSTTANGALTALGGIGNITSTDGSVTITSPSATTKDLSVAVAAATNNVICQVRNTTGATLTKGTVVYISGATGQLPTVSKALATSDATSAQTLGMMSADLANNSNGNVTVIGLITNIDTSAYTDGQQLYLSGTTAGAVTATKPYAPIHLVYVAVVEHAHPTQGKLFVKVQNGYELDEIHNVSAQSPSNGQTIVYNSATSLWENNTVSLTLGVNGTLPIANGGTGQTTANAAFNALAPSQTGNSGKYLTTNGTNTSWATNPLGDVVGPASATNNGIALFDGTTGKLIKDSASTDGLIYGLTVGRGAGGISTNTAVGASALVANTTGNNNLAIGYQAGSSVVTAINTTYLGSNSGLYQTGNGNVGVGTNSLTGVSGASIAVQNTAVGKDAMYSNTTGNASIGIGWSSLFTNSTGSNNVAIGAAALFYNTVSNNTAVGYQAGYNNTTGTENVFIGQAAGYSVTTSSGQTFVGRYAGFNTTTGPENSALGDGALTYNTTGAYNTAIGRSALQANTTASNNTAVGYQAGYSNVTGTRNFYGGYQAGYASTGGNNTAVGYLALSTNTTGTDNTAIGQAALGLTNTNTGDGNVAVGSSSLRSNSTGAYNTAVGGGIPGNYAAAMQTNTTGSYNTALGNGSLGSNTTASNNTAVGYQAGYSNTTGSPIDAFGYGALFSNTTGNYNSAFGLQTLRQNTTGSNNVAIGPQSLVLNTTGSNNTAVGYQSLYSNTTSGNLVALGYQAGYSYTTGNAAVVIGYRAGYNNTTGSESTFIGYSTGLSNTTGSYNVAVGSQALVNSTTGSDNVAIGTGAMQIGVAGSGNTAVGNISLKNTTGSLNSALGFYALGLTTSGNYNTGIGGYALNNNTTASNNTAVGYQAAYANTTGTTIDAFGKWALFQNTTGNENSAFGYASLYTNSTGSSNAAFARSALEKNTSGSFNVAIGEQSLFSNTTASENTAVGYQSLYSNTTGYNNISFGHKAGFSMVSGTNNTFIGHNSGYLSTGNENTFVGEYVGYNTTGSSNTFIGRGSSLAAGYLVTTGSKNTIIGAYTGNQGGLDIRTASNYIVLSDGDGNPRAYWNGANATLNGSVAATGGWAGTTSSAGKLGGVVQSFVCERNGTGVATNVMAFGNGSTLGKGVRMPFAGKLVLATLTGTTVTGTVTVDVYQNGTANSSYRLTATATAADIGVTQNFSSSPLSFAAGDTIGWYQTVVPTTASVYNVNFYVIFD